MTDDLVSRLLAAIQEREDVAKAAVERCGDGEWHTDDEGVVYTDKHSDRILTGPWGNGLHEIGDHIEANAPASVLRLCQAHRDIVSAYTGALFTQECHPDDERNNGYVLGISRAVVDLAGGYGIEAQS